MLKACRAAAAVLEAGGAALAAVQAAIVVLEVRSTAVQELITVQPYSELDCHLFRAALSPPPRRTAR
jgi:hypothetical protein